MEIVDTQVHGNRFGPGWDSMSHESIIERMVGAMDALGIATTILDEYTKIDDDGKMCPGEVESDGFWRPKRPFSELAVQTYPTRFRYLWRVNPADPQLEKICHTLRQRTGVVAIRVQGYNKTMRVWREPGFETGGFDNLFRLAGEYNIPLFMVMQGGADLLAPHANRFPETQFIIDHVGMERVDRDAPDDVRYSGIDRALALADSPNVAIKWSHVERWARDPYPFGDVPPHLRRIVDAFGSDRVMWASDTVGSSPRPSDHPTTWAKALFQLIDSAELTGDEKEWLLGGTARKLLPGL